jgi:hypothetical protein
VKYTVEMFGLSPFTEDNAVELEMKEDATLSDLFASLAEKMPSFKGRVIEEGQRRLVENYGIYVNGQFISDHQDVRVKSTDRIVLILLAVGG